MAQIVKLRRSSVSGQKPTNSNLQLGELALNTTDGKVYMAKSGSLGPSVEELITTNAVNTGSITISGSINLLGNQSITGSLIVSDGVGYINTGLIAENSDLVLTSGSDIHVEDGGIVSASQIWGDGSHLINIPTSGVTDLTIISGSLDNRLDALEFYSSSQQVPTASYALRTTQTDVYVKNMSGAQINKGTVVRIVGAVGDNPLIGVADFLTEGQSANTLGIATQNIPNDSFGLVITEGVLIGVNTSGMTAGQLLFLDGDGTFTTDYPVAPNHGVRLGEVLRAHQNNGSIYVRIDNGSELGEAHNVVDTTTNSSYGDLLVKSGSIWTNSKSLNGDYNVTGSLTITQNLTVLGSSSLVYVTSSYLTVSASFISVNVFEPAERFGGLKVYDSGSSNATASLAWDSFNNHWVYQNASGSSYSGGMLLSGPRNSGSLGEEAGLTSGRIAKSVGGDHLDNSIISETGDIITVYGDLVANSITGSFDFYGLNNKPTLVSGSSQIEITGTTGYSEFSGSISSSIGELSSSVATTTSGLDSSIGSLSSSIATTTSNLSSSVATTTSDLSSSIGSLSSSVATTTFNVENRLDSIEGVTGSYATTGSNVFIGNQTITGSLFVSNSLFIGGGVNDIVRIKALISSSLIPDSDGIHHFVGAQDRRWEAVYAKTGSFEEIHGTLGSIVNIFHATVSGSFTGDGTGLYNIPASGVTGLQLDKIINGNASASIDDSGLYVNRDVYIDGTLTAKELHIDYVTSSVLYQSGSTKFGDSSDDNHNFTGSVYIGGNLNVDSITGSLNFDNLTHLPTLVSGSSQIDITGTTGYSTFSGSISSSIDTLSSSIALTDYNQELRLNSIESATSSLNSFTSSYATGSFTGSFIGDGLGLYNIPASGVTGLQLDKIISGNASASIDDTGLYVNRDVYIDGSLTAKELHIDYVTSSVLYQSGSTKFGDSADDTHMFTGSVFISNSLFIGGGVSDVVRIKALISSSLIPDSDGIHHFVGASDRRWEAVYAKTGSFNEIHGTLGSVVNIFNATVTGSFTGSFIGDASGLTMVPFHISGSDISGTTVNKTFTKLQFDDSTGLNVEETDPGTAFVSIGSHFKDIFVSGSSILRATGSDAFEIISAGGIEITTSTSDTNGNGYVKELNISATSLSSSLNDRIDIITGSIDSLNLFTSSVVLTSETGSMTVLSSSYALTASYALNAGGGAEGRSAKLTQSSPSTTWTFNHNLGEQYPEVTVYDSSGYVVIPTNILAYNNNQMIITFSSAQSGTVTATVGGGLPAISASYAGYVLSNNGTSPSWKSGILSGSLQIGQFGYATTGSNTFIDNQVIDGTLTINNARIGSVCTSISTNNTIFNLGSFDGANIDYVVKSGLNMRGGMIMGVWNGSNVQYTETSTMDLGDTTPITFAMTNDGKLNAIVASGTWTVEAMYRALGCSSINPTPTPTATPNQTLTPTPTPTLTLTPTLTSSQTPTPTPTATDNPNAGTWDLYMKSQALVSNPNYSDFDLFWKEGNGSWIRHIENTFPVSTTYVSQFPDIAVNSGSTISFALYRNSQPAVPIEFGAGFNGAYTGYCGYDNPYVKTFDGTENQGVYINVAVVSDDLVTCGATNYMISTGSTAPDYCSGLYGSDISVYGNSSDWLNVTRFFTNSNLTTPFNGNLKYYGNSTADYGTTLRIDSNGWVVSNYAC